MYCVHFFFLFKKGILNWLYQDVFAGVYFQANHIEDIVFHNFSDNFKIDYF